AAMPATRAAGLVAFFFGFFFFGVFGAAAFATSAVAFAGVAFGLRLGFAFAGAFGFALALGVDATFAFASVPFAFAGFAPFAEDWLDGVLPVGDLAVGALASDFFRVVEIGVFDFFAC